MKSQVLPRMRARSGVAVNFILALLLSVCVITLTWYMGGNKVTIKPSVLFRLKADYQMESAILLQFHRLKASETKFNQGLSETSGKQEIAPGIFLTSFSRKVSEDEFTAVAHIEGGGVNKILNGRMFRPASKGEIASGSTNAGFAGWQLEFVPDFKANL